MTEMKMFWLNENNSFDELREDMEQTSLKGFRLGRKANPHRLYVVSKESAEVVIKEIRYAGYTVKEITNYD